jgi:hypothetical protein
MGPEAMVISSKHDVSLIERLLAWIGGKLALRKTSRLCSSQSKTAIPILEARKIAALPNAGR